MGKEIRKIAVLASGNGTTLQAIIDAVDEGDLGMVITIVMSDNENAKALERAKRACIIPKHLEGKNDEERDEEILYHLSNIVYDVDMIVLAGYLRKIGPEVLKRYPVINTHPSLLPKYGGKGMYGMNVHRAVVENGETESGVTVHFVNSEYDRGPIIWQTHVPVYPTDTAEDVSERVQRVEKAQLINVLKAFSEGKIEF